MDKQVFGRIEVPTIVDWIVNQIVQAIIDGTVKPGERLPSEASLVEQMGVGRNSVREAIKILSAYGIVEQRRTDGSFVREEFSPKLLNPLVYGVILGKNSYRELSELREILEKGIFRLAIEYATQEDIQRVQENMALQIERAKDPTVTGEEIANLDIAFHELICKCTHNELMIQLFAMVNRVTQRSRVDTQSKLLAEGRISYTLEAHQKLCDALAARDFANADEIVEYSHLEWQNVIESK